MRSSKAFKEDEGQDQSNLDVLAAIPEESEREEVPEKSISMDTWHRYQHDKEKHE